MRLRYLHIPELVPLKNVSITFGHEPILGRACTIHFIVGVNGTGKSRLLRAIPEIFLSLEKDDVPPFPVTLAYDLGRSLPGQEDSQAERTIYYRYTGHGKASAYMVELHHISLYEHVNWEQFHLFDWEHADQQNLSYRVRNYFPGVDSAVKSHLPSVVLAYTSGSPDDWEVTFSPPDHNLEEAINTVFPQVQQDQAERRAIERPLNWNSRKEADLLWQAHAQDTQTELERLGARETRLEEADSASIGIFIHPQTLKLVICAVTLSQLLVEFKERPTEQDKEGFIQEIEHAIENKQDMGGLRDILNEIDWLWPVTIGLRIAFHRERFKSDQIELLKRLYLVATKVIRDSEPSSSRTLFFDLQRIVYLEKYEEYDKKSTLEALIGILGGMGADAFSMFKQLLLLQQQGVLEDITIALKKRQVEGVLLYEWLSDGERVFLGRMALFHLLKGFDDTLIILDEPETHFNDIWKREIVDVIDSSLRNDTSEIVLSTHSSITLTDVFDTEITLLKKNPYDATVYTTRPTVRSFGASPDDILQEIFGAPESVGLRASEFLDLMLTFASHPQETERLWALDGNDEAIKTDQAFDTLLGLVKAQPGSYAAEQTSEELNQYLLGILRSVYAYTRQYYPEVNMLNALDVLQKRLGPGFYQFEFRRRLKALREDSDATSDKTSDI